ncbi:unnamed protein product [Citrullus colocynthis]|uniref:Uncharacterized protein n=1 Tax=Citrullus colocynthis TaxID=252529 RepID=A0ABP0Z5J0_9ROSI
MRFFSSSFSQPQSPFFIVHMQIWSSHVYAQPHVSHRPASCPTSLSVVALFSSRLIARFWYSRQDFISVSDFSCFDVEWQMSTTKFTGTRCFWALESSFGGVLKSSACCPTVLEWFCGVGKLSPNFVTT